MVGFPVLNLKGCARVGLFDIFKKKKADQNTASQSSDDSWFEANRDKLNQEAMKRSEDFAKVHNKALSKININALKNITSFVPVDLSPKEILFLDYINGVSTSNLNIARYWTHEYNLDYQKTLEKLFKCGYLTFSDYKFNMTQCKVDELKNVLKSHGLKVSGKKADLINRLIENLPEDELKELFSESCFMITDAGAAITQKNSHIMYFHRHFNQFGISIDEADRYFKLHPGVNQFDIALILLYDRAKKYRESKDWGLYRNDLYAMSIVYKDMKEFEKEMDLLLKVCYLDLSGLENNDGYDKNFSFLAPGILGSLDVVQKELGLSDEQLKAAFSSSVDDLNLPKAYYSKPKAFAKIISERNKMNE